MSMHRVLLVYNPAADHGRAAQKASDLRAIVEEMGGADWQATEYPAHASEIAQSAADRGYTTVVALGGDGTVHEVVNGLMRVPAERRPRLGMVPIGSGNDFAVTMRASLSPPLAMQRVWGDQEHIIDVALIRDGHGRSEYFNNTSGIGFTGAINIRSRQIKVVHGFMMYFLATVQSILANFDMPHMRLSFDNGQLDQPTLMLAVCNGPREGGGFRTAPDARLNDGLLDMVYVGRVSQFRLMQLLPLVMAGKHLREPDVHCVRTTRVTLDADKALPIHIDGELFAPYEADVRHVEIEVVPAALRVVT
jgi:diacylglycerol kinase (ATP)